MLALSAVLASIVVLPVLTSLEVPSTDPPEAPPGLTAEEWSDLRAAFLEDRYTPRRVDDDYFAGNPGQRWRARFDGRGVTVEPSARGWTWGLELVSYGFAGAETMVRAAEGTSAEGRRIAYAWNDGLEEWYVNDERGLAHGYVLHRRPSGGGAGSLTFTLAVRGELHAAVTADRRGVRFRDDAGADVLTYSGLRVFDAEGRDLPAQFMIDTSHVQLRFDDRDARYPVTIDPVVQQAYIKASNTEPYDAFGTSVAVAGDTVAVGAPLEDSSSPGVNGDQLDNAATDSGAVFVYTRSGTSWAQQAYIKASNPDPGDKFGEQIAISGDTLVIGARMEESAATGINGDDRDNRAPDAGAVYVLVRTGTSWSQQAYVKASNADGYDQFGCSVSIDGDTLAVGASGEDSFATGVNGDQYNNIGFGSGAAYVFVRVGTTWSQQAYVKASATDYGDIFGSSVAVSGDSLIVGAPYEDSPATGMNGDQSSNAAERAGAAYAFGRNGTTWSQQAYIKSSNPEAQDKFGLHVALSGDTAVIGTPWEDGGSTGINGNQTSNSRVDSGAVYALRRIGTTWHQEAYVKASDTSDGDFFGDALAILGDTLVVGAPRARDYSMGVMYTFRRSGTTWGQVAYRRASNYGYWDYFGSSVALSIDLIVAGAVGEDSKANGVNGNQGDANARDSGAAYAFDARLPDASCAWYCGAGTNLDTYAVLAGCVLGDTFQGSVGFTAPNLGAVLAGYLGQLTFPLWGQQGLVNIATPEVTGLPAGFGVSPVLLDWSIPNEPAYAGFHVFTQAAGIGGGVINLTCAFDCTVGF